MHVALMVLVVAGDVTVPLSSLVIVLALLIGEEDMERYRCKTRIHRGDHCHEILKRGE